MTNLFDRLYDQAYASAARGARGRPDASRTGKVRIQAGPTGPALRTGNAWSTTGLSFMTASIGAARFPPLARTRQPHLRHRAAAVAVVRCGRRGGCRLREVVAAAYPATRSCWRRCRWRWHGAGAAPHRRVSDERRRARNRLAAVRRRRGELRLGLIRQSPAHRADDGRRAAACARRLARLCGAGAVGRGDQPAGAWIARGLQGAGPRHRRRRAAVRQLVAAGVVHLHALRRRRRSARRALLVPFQRPRTSTGRSA